MSKPKPNPDCSQAHSDDHIRNPNGDHDSNTQIVAKLTADNKALLEEIEGLKASAEVMVAEWGLGLG